MRRIELHSEIRSVCKAVECFQLMVSNVLRPGDGIGIRVGLRSQILGVRVSSGAPSLFSIMAVLRSPKPLVGVRVPQGTPTMKGRYAKVLSISWSSWQWEVYMGQ